MVGLVTEPKKNGLAQAGPEFVFLVELKKRMTYPSPNAPGPAAKVCPILSKGGLWHNACQALNQYGYFSATKYSFLIHRP